MKVILLQDVAKVGRKYEVKEVADGFAQNCLLKQGKAELATKESLARLDKIKNHQSKNKENLLKKFDEAVALLKVRPVVIKVKASKEGHLFAGLKKGDIVKEIKIAIGINLDSDWIKLETPIKTIGDNEIRLQLESKTASFVLTVEAI